MCCRWAIGPTCKKRRGVIVACMAASMAFARYMSLPFLGATLRCPFGVFPRRSAHAQSRLSRLATLTGGSEVMSDTAVFDALERELARFTGLQSELHFLVAEGREAACSGSSTDAAKLKPIRDYLEVLQAQKQPGVQQVPVSLGPLAVAVARHPSLGREIIILGTPHYVPGTSAEDNPVPSAVKQTIARLKPDIVAVELDRDRGMKELSNLPTNLWGRTPVALPADQAPVADGSGLEELKVDEELMNRIRGGLGSGPISQDSTMQATRQIFTESSDKSIAMNFFALQEMCSRSAGDWGKDVSATVEAAAKAGKPLLLCDLPQERTMSQVVPIYARAFAQARQERLQYLNDGSRALRALAAEEKLFADCLMSGRGGDLPRLYYGIGLCRPAIGWVEAEAQSVWLQERDPAMAAAVDAALSGQARSASGQLSPLKPAKRAVLMVGCYHVRGVANCLETTHGYQLVSAPKGGWDGPSSGTSASTSGGRPVRPGTRREQKRGGRRTRRLIFRLISLWMRLI